MHSAIKEERLRKMYMAGCTLLFTAALCLFMFVEPSYATLQAKIDGATDKVLVFFQSIFGGIAMIMICLMGYSYFISKSAEGLADMKGRFITFIVCMFLVLGAEPIYTTFEGWIKG